MFVLALLSIDIVTMKCSRPISIPYPGLPDRPSQAIPGMKPRMVNDTLIVPCGKCMACCEKRQKDLAFRIRMEAEKRGTLAFVTLTYSNDHLPLVQTLWRCDKLTGECDRLTPPEFVCYSGREDFYNERQEMAQIAPSKFPRYIDRDLFQDREFKYFARITPSVCRKDVQNWLKRCRVHFERNFGCRLDFSYSICSEYGAKFCRPHYHCCIMGLSLPDVEEMCRLWKFGFYKIDWIPRVNSDGSDGFGRVANYVAKYVSKGDFRCESEKDCTAFPARQMDSKGLGNYIVETFRNYALAFDVVGAPYNPDNFWCESAKRYLRRDEISALISEVPKRLAVSFDGKFYYAIPRLIRNKIFYVQTERENILTKKKVKYSRPTKLWRMVADSIREQLDALDQRQFRALCADKSPREIAKAVSTFNLESENFASASDETRKSDYQARLQSSVF